MKTLLRLVPLLLSALLIGCAQNPAKSGGAYAPDGAGFSVQMPGPAKAGTAANGTHVFTTEVDDRAYIASYTDLGKDRHLTKAQVNRVLDAATRGVTTNGSELLSKSLITIDGHDARDLRLKLKSGHFMRVRITLVGARLFQVGVVTEMKDARAPQIKRYLDSFHLDAK